MHSTNYRNTFIAVAEDCPAEAGTVPPLNEAKRTIASLQFELIVASPYTHTSDDVLYHCAETRRALDGRSVGLTREEFFAKPQACLRASPLVKKYGWGIHHNADGKIALYGVETLEYAAFLDADGMRVVNGMRSKKA